MLPLFDDKRRVWLRRPWVTWCLLAACILLWLPQLYLAEGQLAEMFLRHGLVPSDLSAAALFSSLFLHAGAGHLAGNMLYLWVFADNVEDAMGHLRFLLFYLACGALASLGHAGLHPASDIPLVGASGAISGVLGAYLVLYPKARILVPIIIFPLWVPAWAVIGLWFVFQGVSALSPSGEASSIAWWAHLSGFAAGLMLVWPLRRRATMLFGGGALPQGVRLRRED